MILGRTARSPSGLLVVLVAGGSGSSVSEGRPTGKRCWKCNSNNWSRQHVCGTGIRSKGSAKVLRVLSSASSPSSSSYVSSVDTAVNLAVLSAAAGSRSGASSAFAGDVVSSDEDDVSSGLALDEPMEDVIGLGDLKGRASTLVSTMAKVSVRDDAAAITALNAQDCKFDVRFSAAPAMKTNCICVPIVVQNVLCFGLVDSGATFSCITNEFFTFLGGQSISTF
ncbi:hypothetical protein BD408DRAFT_96870 [Parasitella parasitica]|nr:hypothetical protein BD408DRAFT_96870 [Parasitella parasitica]